MERFQQFLLRIFAAFTFFFFFNCVFCLTTLTAQHRQQTVHTIRTIDNIIYDSSKKLAYDLYIPAKLNKNSDCFAMIFIHGGGWIKGSRKDEKITDYCRKFATDGYITASIDYSLIQNQNPRKPGKRTATVTFNTMLQDITRFLVHFKQNMNKKNIKIKKIALSGYSAGGHLAMLYAFTRKEQSPLPIAFVFQQVGPTHFDPIYWNRDMAGDPFRIISGGSGMVVTEKDHKQGKSYVAIKRISPTLLVNSKTVPGIYAYGEKDRFVPPSQGKALEKVLKQYRIDYKMLYYPGSTHYTIRNNLEYERKYRKLILEYANKYFR